MIKKAEIIGDNISYGDYSRQSAKRGEKDFSLSRSEIMEFALCPNRWVKGYGEYEDSNSSTNWGNLIDCLLTSRERFDELFAVAPETYPDAKTGDPKPFNMNSKWCKEWVESQSGKTVLKPATVNEAIKAVTAIRENAMLDELFACSKKQVMVTGFWVDEATSIEIPIRVLIDIVPPANHKIFGKWLCDFKTTRSGDPSKWARVVDDYGYDVQAALIRDLYVAATGEERIDFVHVVQENVSPFHVVNPPPALSSEFLEWGRTKYRMALRLYAQCVASNEWPSYQQVGIPFGNTQIIGPEDLWRYKTMQGFRMDRNDARPEDLAPETENEDLIP